METTNPWTALPETAPFVLEDDRTRFVSSQAFDTVRPSIMPKQFVGGLHTAQLVVLAKAPLFNPTDESIDMQDQEFLAANRANLLDPYDSDFYYFREGFEKYSGFGWWSRILNPLLADGVTQDDVRRSMMVIQFFPYHVEGEPPLDVRIHSQDFAYALVREAMKRRLPIVIMAPKAQWYKAVPELKSYGLKITLKNAQNGVFSRGNIDGGLLYDLIKRSLTS